MKKYKLQPELSFSEYINVIYPNKSKNITTITFQVTEDCCMTCTYCYQHNKTNNKMTFETAKIFIDKLLKDEFDIINRNNTSGVVLDFIGGEPLMEIELIQNIWEYYLKQVILQRHPWINYSRFSICSNGLLYNNKKVQEFLFKYHKFGGLTISIDGNKELHDKCRLDLNGNGTYDRVIKSVHNYFNHFNSIPLTKMTLSPDNIQYLSNAVFNLINEKYEHIHLNCIFEPGWEKKHAQIMYNELKIVADYIIANNLYDKVYISLFEETNFQPLSEEENNNWCGGIADKSLAINYKGNFYPCLRYMESSLNNIQPPIILGDIQNGYLKTVDSQLNYQKISNITRRSQSTDECYYCPIAKGCAWCSGYNYEEFGTPNKRATHICIMHQARSLANVYYWNTLYKYLNINKHFEMYIPKEWALNIIDEKEYNYLLNLSEEYVYE